MYCNVNYNHLPYFYYYFKNTLIQKVPSLELSNLRNLLSCGVHKLDSSLQSPFFIDLHRII